jgi:hypothetical protein
VLPFLSPRLVADVSLTDLMRLHRSLRGTPSLANRIPVLLGAIFAFVTIALAGCQSDRFRADEALWYGADIPTWTVGDSAIFSVRTIGLPNDTIHLFGIQTAMFGNGEDILLGIGGTDAQILSMDTLGELRWTAGRIGDGPGEFRAISDLVAVGDTTFVWDGARRTVAVFEESAFRR